MSNSIIKKMLPLLGIGALAATETLSKKVNASKHTEQTKLSEKQRKARKAKSQRRKSQKLSRRRNRK